MFLAVAVPLQKYCIKTNKIHCRERRAIFAFSRSDTTDMQYVEQGLNSLFRKKPSCTKMEVADTGSHFKSELHLKNKKKGRKEEPTVL